MSKPKLIAAGFMLAGGLFAASSLAPSASPQLPQPHENHGLVQANAGVWDGKFEMFGDFAMTGEVTETIEEFGPYWAITTLEGELGGMPFQGRYQLGYDVQAKEFKGTWIDTMEPAMSVMTGSYDKASKTLTMRHRAPDQTGRVTDHWNTSTTDDQGRRIFEGFVKLEDGSAFKTMRIVYTRRPAEKKAGGE